MKTFFTTIALATSLLCAGLWFWGCSKPVGGTIPLRFSIAFIDSTGANISEKLFPTFHVIYLENGVRQSTTRNFYRLRPTTGIYNPVIEMPPTLMSSDVMLLAEYIVSTDSMYIGTFTAHIKDRAYQEVRFNGIPLTPLPLQISAAGLCYVVRLQ
jgi:hypothetical protein